jgi:2-dehydro-3-deoxyphosphogluconate aldolase / (4S)-4-hydroxy-2-oxoglutarate aldolase
MVKLVNFRNEKRKINKSAKMQNIILEKKLIPVAVIDSVDCAVPLAEALIGGGLNVIEVTLRTEAALEAMQAIKQHVPEMIVGAGTILDHELIPQLIDIGVSFGISPGLNPLVIESADKHKLPIMPGVITPSEIEHARAYGLDILKFFPAEAAGGATMLKALAGPYGHTGIKFIPTGGINLDNLEDYLNIGCVAAVGGSWFVAKDLVQAQKFDEISQLTKQALALIQNI